MWAKYLLPIALVAPFSAALLRFPCSQLVTERLDPLVTPGQVSPHLHQIVGGTGFNISMDPALDLPGISSCTTCRFVEDHSNYWTAVLYFKHRNGSYLRVPQMANHNTGPGLQDGGMTVYYFQPPNNIRATAFPKGFRMRVGNPFRRSNDLPANDPLRTATTFRCFSGTDLGSSAPGSPPDTFDFPKSRCTGGIRSNIYFPACWDGKNLDSADHESHMAYPNGGFFGTSCPASHPVRMPLLFIEIVWDTRPFNDASMWPTDGSQPLVFSMGDPTGFGQHADYVFGWEGDSLQRAMDTCTDGAGIPTACKALTVQPMSAMNKCKQPAKVPEIVEAAYLPALPGCNPLQAGPSQATPIANCAAPSTLTDKPVQTATIPIATPPWSVCAPGKGSGLVPGCDSIPETAGPPQPTQPPVSSPAPTQPPPPGPPVQTPAPGTPAAPKWGQCGGQGWTGPTTCVSGSTCTFQNQWYSQCI